ncbi:MAG: hypothetical protein JOZ98_05145 [Solirubrobacterales bacterium]|nr:hypothetical protein [Solirubrobacterales bacterium]MBV9422272.1 hypothetical protein [Solirubrobacterales bacterium]MBV9799966.1 hypothetical protein [Solirubrobacterales bacterium]
MSTEELVLERITPLDVSNLRIERRGLPVNVAALAGRYLHAELDPPEVLRGRIEEIQAGDLNAIRLRR